MALKEGSKPDTTVRVAYDLKPSITTSSMNMAAAPFQVLLLLLLLGLPCLPASLSSPSEGRRSRSVPRPRGELQLLPRRLLSWWVVGLVEWGNVCGAVSP
jgi:hypothetical protein